MEHELVKVPNSAALAELGSDFAAERARSAIASRGVFHLALSGGKTPWAMFELLAAMDLPWNRVVLFQVDERVAPDRDPDRNLTHIRQTLGRTSARIVPMPVEEADLGAAADRYAGLLPERFDLVHLGIGPDGHTASLVPGDPVLEEHDRLVALTGDYQGHRRMTLTYPALARADELLWLVSGEDKRGPLAKLLARDCSIPAGRVEAFRSTVMADPSAV